MRKVRPVLLQRLQDFLFWLIVKFSLQLLRLDYKYEFSQIGKEPSNGKGQPDLLLNDKIASMD
jgi:hypothetical protein